MAGSPTAKNADKLVARAQEIGLDNYSYADNPAIFWDLYGQQGHPVRTTVSEMGPLLLSRLMGLNETQEGVPFIASKYRSDEQTSELQSLMRNSSVVFSFKNKTATDRTQVTNRPPGSS